MKYTQILRFMISAQALTLSMLSSINSMEDKKYYYSKDIIKKISSFLDNEDRRNLALVSKKFNQFIAETRWSIKFPQIRSFTQIEQMT